MTERVQTYTLELRERRRQAGLICNPSSELLEAERRLAEVSSDSTLVNTESGVDSHHNYWSLLTLTPINLVPKSLQ